jgi:hypothetical protein
MELLSEIKTLPEFWLASVVSTLRPLRLVSSTNTVGVAGIPA